MTSTVGTESVDTAVLARSLEAFRQHTRMDMVFGGPVRRGSVAMEITALRGARTSSAANLVVRNGQGLGGKALLLGRPVVVANYFAAEGITHIYDHAVRPEALETLTAVPIAVDRVPRLLMYLGARAQVALGDRWMDSFAPLVRRVERDLAIEDEVRRRLALVQRRAPERSALSFQDLRDIACELADLAANANDDTLRARIRAVEQRFEPALERERRDGPQPSLRGGEIAVLEAVARGLSNRAVADELGLQPNTVKSYLQNAMRKLGVFNRVQAITAAREHRLI